MALSTCGSAAPQTRPPSPRFRPSAPVPSPALGCVSPVGTSTETVLITAEPVASEPGSAKPVTSEPAAAKSVAAEPHSCITALSDTALPYKCITMLSGPAVLTLPSGLRLGWLPASAPACDGLAGLLDVLVTEAWPGSRRAAPHDDLDGLLRAAQPRYHFSYGQSFAEAAPYENLDAAGSLVTVTRFLSLAPALDPASKWAYAMAIEPAVRECPDALRKRPSNTVASPYRPAADANTDTNADADAAPNFFFPAGEAAKRPTDAVPAGDPCAKRPRTPYVCRICHEPGHRIHDCPQRTAGARIDTSAPGACWFCLSNPAVRKHLILGIGEELYIALAKGGLIPEHLLLIPIEHHPAQAGLGAAMAAELAAALHKLRAVAGRDWVWFCHRQSPAHHLHVQAVGIPADTAASFPAFAASFAASRQAALEACPAEGLLREDAAEFLLAQPSAGLAWRRSLADGAYFPASFGRELLAHFLGVANRTDWRQSPLTEAEERTLASDLQRTVRF